MSKERYKNDPAYRTSVLATNKKWIQGHRKQRAAYLAAYRQLHLEEARERAKRWKKSVKGKRWTTDYAKKYRRKNRAKIASYNRRYNHKNRKARTESARLYWQAHPEVQRKASKRYLLKHPLLCRQRAKQYRRRARRKNPHISRESNARARCRKSGVPVIPLCAEHYKAAWRFFNSRCAYCGKRKKLTADHLRPLGVGGHCITNIVPACFHCNRSKSSRRWQTWFKQQRFFSCEREKRILLWKQKGA